MNSLHKLVFRLLLLTLGTVAPAAAGAASKSVLDANDRPGDLVWIERPWEARYVIYISDDWELSKRVSSKQKPGEAFLTWESVFNPIASIVLPQHPYSRLSPRLDIVPIEFDSDGVVTSAHTHGSPLRGRINRIRSLVLSEGDQLTSKQYHVANWFTGVGDASTHWAPAFCLARDMRHPWSDTDEFYTYGKAFKRTDDSRTFGCREWAYQLYDDERPYIDVTSYVPKTADSPDGTYVREVFGWARFGDKKPIIGKHEKTWYCFHDCPAGAKPGAINDIKSWASQNGWGWPRPPTKAPTFPDPPGKSGTYPK